MKLFTMLRMRAVQGVLLVAALWGTTGCANWYLLGRKLDMPSERVGTAKPIFEGHLKSSQRVGALVALQFSNGQSFEVAECPATLVPGDVVRIYKIDNGFSAHLWTSSQSQLKS